jgi:hypothetical protein
MKQQKINRNVHIYEFDEWAEAKQYEDIVESMPRYVFRNNYDNFFQNRQKRKDWATMENRMSRNGLRYVY